MTILRVFPIPNILDPVVQIEYNPRTNANLVFGTGSNVQQNNDTSGNARHGLQSTGAFQPDQIVADPDCNNVNILNFAGAQDALIAQSSTTFVADQAEIGIDFVVFASAIPAAIRNVFKIFGAGSGENRATFQFNTNGDVRFSSKRVQNDNNLNTTATSFTRLIAGIANWYSISCNYNTGILRVRRNQNQENIAILNQGVQGWLSGLGNTENVASVQNAILGTPSGGNSLLMKIGDFRCWTGHFTDAQIDARYETMQAIFDVPRNTVTITVPSSPLWRDHGYLSVGGYTDEVVLSGTVTHGGDAQIQVRWIDVNDLTTEGKTWETAGLSINNTWTFNTENLPDGDWYPEARKLGETQFDAVRGTNKYGVGDRPLLIGQSPMRKVWGGDVRYVTFARADIVVTLSVDPTLEEAQKNRRWSGAPNVVTGVNGGWFSTSRQDGYDATTGLVTNSSNNLATGEKPSGPNGGPGGQDYGGNGLTAFCELKRVRTPSPIATKTRPVYPIAYAIGGSPLRHWVATTNPVYIAAETGINWAYMLTTINQDGGPKGKLSYTVWAGGEEECSQGIKHLDGTTPATDAAAVTEMVNQFLTVHQQLVDLTGDSNHLMYICLTIRMQTSGANDQRCNNVLDAEMYVLDNYPTKFRLAYNPRDRSILVGDTQHLDLADYAYVTMPRLEVNRSYDENLIGFTMKGPKFLSGTCAAGSNKVVLLPTYPPGSSSLQGAAGNTVIDKVTGLPTVPSGGSATATGLTQFDEVIEVNGTMRAITAAYLQAGADVAIEFNGASASAGHIIKPVHQRGKNPNNAMVVYDNRGAPAQPTRAGFQVVAV